MTIGAMVDRERRYLYRAELLAVGLLATGAAALLLALGAALLANSRWLQLPRALPLVVWLMVIMTLATLANRTRRRLAVGGSRRDVALAIEAEQGVRRGLLVGALEIEGTGALAARAELAARQRLPKREPLAPRMRQSSTRRAMLGGGIAVTGGLVLLTVSPVFGDGLRAVLRPLEAWNGTLLERPRIDGVPRELLRGSVLHARVQASGRRTVEIAIRQVGAPVRTDTLTIDPVSGSARWTLARLQGDLSLVASDGRATSDSVVVHAVDRPFVSAVAIRAVYPAYLARPAEFLSLSEPLRLPRGTSVSISGRASVPLASVTLIATSGDTHPLAVVAQQFSGRVLVSRSMQLRWIVNGERSIVAEVPERLDIVVLEDSAPRVTITSPITDTLLATDERPALSLTVTDDHGIASVLLRATPIVGGREGTSSTQLLVERIGVVWSGDATVDLTAAHLQPGEMLRVRGEATDLSPWAQRGVSRDLIIKRPTMDERRDRVRALGDSAIEAARSAAVAQRSLADRTDEAARAQARAASSSRDISTPTSGSPKPAMTFEGANKSRELAQQQREMISRVERLRDATKQLQEQLRAAGALDTSLARQLGEAQTLLRQALTPEMTAHLQRLESAAQQMNPDQSRDALRDLAHLQQRMREQLERSAEMLKRAAHEGAMQTLGDQAKELADRERALADSAESSREGADSRRATDLAQRSHRLREQMEHLRDRLAKDRADAGAHAVEQAREHASKSEATMLRFTDLSKPAQGGTTQQDKQEASGARAQKDERSDVPGVARAAAADMDESVKAMRQARSEQVREWKRELTSELDRAVQELMQFAREERSLDARARSKQLDADQREAQSTVEQGVSKTNERLQGAGKKSALLSPRSQRAVGDAKERVAQATQRMSQPSIGAAQRAGALGEAADALTKAAASLARDREHANTAGSASGFGEMIQEMKQTARRQSQINAQAEALIGMPAGAAEQSLARAVAREQRRVAEQIEDAGDGAGGELAGQLAKEARQLADQLDGGRLDTRTLARQQQLFRRLLDAGRSLEKEEREDSGKREATSARGNESFTPSGAAIVDGTTRVRSPTWAELRGLSAGERRAILDYFARLNNASHR